MPAVTWGGFEICAADEWAPARSPATPFASMTDDQLLTTINTEYGLVPPRLGMLGLAARLSANTRVHDTATLRAVADGRICPSMIQVLARIGRESSHYTPASL